MATTRTPETCLPRVPSAEAGEPIWPWIERFPDRQAELRAGLRFLRDERADWAGAIDRVLAVVEGAPLLNQVGMA